MPSIQIKHVPEDTHAVLRRRAAEAHQSLQEYLRAKLIADAARPSLEEILDEIERDDTGGRVGLAEAAALIREDRDRR